MSDITRSEAIDIIELIMRKYEEDECVCCDIMLGDEDYEALRLARDSLKADEAYQLEYETTTKNDLGVDAVSRQAINGYIDYILSHGMGKKKSFDYIKKFVANLTPVTQEPFINKPCVSEKQCEHDKNEVLGKIRAEIGNINLNEVAAKYEDRFYGFQREVIKILDKYKAETENP